MNSGFPCEMYDDRAPAAGVWNMALDEALLERAIAEGIGHFRLYRWSAPTISLGYFQEYDPADLPEELHGLDVVRRLSGGGAILHHHELTYSCSLPPDHVYSDDPTRLYVDVHKILIAQLAKQDFECEFRGSPKHFSESEPFLCYSRGDERDLVHLEHKIVGSAQRRRKGAILQHGSLLLRRSEFAPQFPGVEDLLESGRSISEEALCEEVLGGVRELFPQTRSVCILSAEISDRVRELIADRYQFVGKRFRDS